MTQKARIKIAAVITALFLAAISAAGLLSQSRLQTPVSAAAPVAAQMTSVQPAPTTIHYQEHD